MISPRRVLSVLACSAILLLAATSWGAPPMRDALVLDGTWSIQPAVRPDVLPKDDQWGTYPSEDWRKRWIRLENKGTAWEKVKRPEVHDLWYRQSFTVPEAWAGKRLLLDFRRIEGDAVVMVNGKRVSELLRPGGAVDITAAARPGKNTLTVFLTRNYTGISRGYEDDPLRHITREKQRISIERWPLGITAPVRVLARPMEQAIDGVLVKTSWRKKRIAVDIDVASTGEVDNVQATVRVFDATGKKVLQLAGRPTSLQQGTRTLTVESPWDDFIPWELDAGYVYTASVELSVAGRLVDRLDAVRFGFREVWTDGRQLIMNGHPIRFRLGWSSGLTPTSLSFFRLMHFNTFEFQPNPSAWWGQWSETPYIDPELLEAMDRTGSAALVLAPGVSHIDKALLDDPRTRRDYTREMRHWIGRYRNHPCILSWIVGMNYVGNKENIHPDGMGRSSNRKGSSNEKVVERAIEITKSIDPTRLVFSHADGNVGDISTSNVYLNFVPLQERIEWPSDWHEHGDMPYIAVEFGQPHMGNYWKGPRFLLTEYLARVFGDDAYRRETLEGLKRTVELGLANTSGHGTPLDFEQFPLWWDHHRLIVHETNRAWRTWGVQGWFYWDFHIAYGNPPGFRPDKHAHVFQRYGLLMDKPVTEPPAWVSPNFHIHREGFRPLLVYLGGHPDFVDRTHSYYRDETIAKQVVFVWDGPGRRRLDVAWSIKTGDDKSKRLGQTTVELNPGDIRRVPVRFPARLVGGGNRKEHHLSVEATEDGRVIARDRIALAIHPRPEVIRTNKRVAVVDPEGRSTPWLKRLGLNPVALGPGGSLDGIDLLVVGRQALKPGTAAPWSAKDIARGLHVLVLEQTWQAWQGLGFRTIETMPRRAFAVDASDSLLRGLSPRGLTCWRGAPDLLPATEWARSYDFYHAPRWGNRHAVASVVLEVPQVVGFRPRLNCEVDLNYTPLVDFHYGKGRITFSTLDFTDRVGTDPDATRLAHNLLTEMLAEPTTETTPVTTIGKVDGKLLEALSVQLADAPNPGGLIVADGSILTFSRLFDCDVMIMPIDGKQAQGLGLQAKRQTIHRAVPPEDPLFRSVGRRLLRWRDGIEVDLLAEAPAAKVYCEGLFAKRTIGDRRWLFVQVPPDAFDSRYPDDDKKQKAVFPSRRNLRQLYARLLTNLGAQPSRALTDRLCTVGTGRRYRTLGSWQVLGPFHLEDRFDPKKVLSTKLPGEGEAIKGDPSPDSRYTLEDKRVLDWRTTVSADASGFVNLGKALERDHHAVAYVTRKIESKTARRARLRLGVDYWMTVWVNGRRVYHLNQGHGAPLPNRHRVDIDLKKGINTITIKVLSGSKGFGFWANLSREGTDAAEDKQEARVELYPLVDPGYDPYEFHYW